MTVVGQVSNLSGQDEILSYNYVMIAADRVGSSYITCRQPTKTP